MTAPARLTRRRALGLALAIVAGTGWRLLSEGRAQNPAADAPPPVPYREIAVRIARDFVVPRTAALAKATAAQAQAWRPFFAAPQQAALARLEAAFRQAAEAWSGVEAVRFGPVGDDGRYERIAHWPERKGAVGKALAGLLAGAEEITPERLRRASVAGQGLSALERLLFGDGEGGAAKARRDLLDLSPTGVRRRALGRAAAQSLARIAAEVLDGWTGPDGTLVRLERATPDEAREAVTRLATDHLALLQAAAEAKVGAVLGRNADEARPLAAEGWRAGRSSAAIRLNLEAAEAFTRAALAHDAEALRAALATLDTPLSVAAELSAGRAPLGEMAADPKRRWRVVLLRDALLSARDGSGPALAEALRVTIGFNSRDGD